MLSTRPLGTVDAAGVADVDPAGWVQPRGATWSLDWWIGAEDRWHQPAREVAVRQRALDGAPGVETAMRVPGGDVVQRAFGVRASSSITGDGAEGGVWDDSAVLVEVENLSAVPVALALVVRPLTLSGAGRVSSVEIDGAVVRVDGRVAAVLSRPAARVAHGPLGSVAAFLAQQADASPDEAIDDDPDGRLEVAVVVPLPHTAVVRILVPRVAAPSRRRWFGFGSRGASVAPEPGGTFTAPGPEAIAKGWAVHTRDAARVDLGDPLLDGLVAASQQSLVLGAGDRFLDRAERAVQVTGLFARSGMSEPLGPLARALVDVQRLNGAVRLSDDGDATAALLFAAAPLLAGGAEAWQELLVGPVAKAVHLLGRGGSPTGAAPSAAGAAALAMVAPSLRAAGQPEVADDAASAARRLVEQIERAAPAGAANGTKHRHSDDLLDQLVALRARIAAGHASAVAELGELARLGDAGSVADRYDVDGVPNGALGHDPGAVAARASAVLDLAVRDDPAGPALLVAWPQEWWGRPLEAHGVRTRHGSVSFGLRWHGKRPAILWEIVPGPGVQVDAAPVLTAPGLDPTWRGEGWTGEALLGEVTVPETPVGDPAGSKLRISRSAPAEPAAPSTSGSPSPATQPSPTATPQSPTAPSPQSPTATPSPTAPPSEGQSFL